MDEKTTEKPAAAAPSTPTGTTIDPSVVTSTMPSSPPPPMQSSGGNKFKIPLIIAGVVVLMLAIGGGLFFVRNSGNVQKPVEPIAQNPTTAPVAPLNLTVDSPVKDSLVTDQKVTVTGKTAPNATVVVYSDNDENTITSDTNGTFSGSVALQNGINTLTVTAFDDSGQQKSQTMDVVYDDGSS